MSAEDSTAGCQAPLRTRNLRSISFAIGGTKACRGTQINRSPQRNRSAGMAGAAAARDCPVDFNHSID
jgi:hypothetical protein